MWWAGAGVRLGPGAPLPGTLDELSGFLGVPLRKAAQVHGLLHDAQVFIQRKGHVDVAVPVCAPVWKPQTAEDSFKQLRGRTRCFKAATRINTKHLIAWCQAVFPAGHFLRE